MLVILTIMFFGPALLAFGIARALILVTSRWGLAVVAGGLLPYLVPLCFFLPQLLDANLPPELLGLALVAGSAPTLIVTLIVATLTASLTNEPVWRND